ncbi:hypothetical protein HHI36_011630 [Cryptolaemus montrouzieri]|uniref:Uncharacterized protein n=1 Tax=Cryptolaemus montrouzieri TaxID=559131 RepID=A0ABD2MMJ8_9CUCU
MSCPPEDGCDCKDLNERVRQAVRDLNALTSRPLPGGKESAANYRSQTEPVCISRTASISDLMKNEIICPNHKKICTRIPRKDPRTVICPASRTLLTWTYICGILLLLSMIAIICIIYYFE